MTRRGQFDFWWRAGLLTVAPLYRLLFRLKFEGLDRIPAAGPAIIAPNHVSVLDPIAVASPRPRGGGPFVSWRRRSSSPTPCGVGGSVERSRSPSGGEPGTWAPFTSCRTCSSEAAWRESFPKGALGSASC